MNCILSTVHDGVLRNDCLQYFKIVLFRMCRASNWKYKRNLFLNRGTNHGDRYKENAIIFFPKNGGC